MNRAFSVRNRTNGLQALTCYKQAEKYAKALRPEAREAQQAILPEISKCIGKLLHKQGKFSQAQRYLDNALRLSGTRSPEVLNELALTHWKQGNWQEMQALCQESLTLAEASGDLFQCAKASHYSGLGYRVFGKPAQSLRAFDRAIALYTQLEQEGELAKVYDSYGGTYYHMGDLDNALSCYEKSKSLDESAGNRYGYALTCGNIGCVFLFKGDLQQAERYFLEDLRISEELHNNFGISKMYENLGHLSTRAGRFEDARQYYDKSLEISETIGDLLSQANSFIGLAELSIDENRPEEALEFCDKASRIMISL